MVTATREFVTTGEKRMINTQQARSNELFNTNNEIEKAFGVNEVSQPVVEPTRRSGLFGGNNEGLNPRVRQSDLNQLEIPSNTVEQNSSITMERLETERVGLTSKNKIFIACFLVAVIALSFFMVIGAINLKNSSSLVNAQQASIDNAQTEIARLEGEINSINGTELQARADKMGFSYAEKTNSYTLLALSDNPVPVSTNWFDAICNFVSSIIG